MSQPHAHHHQIVVPRGVLIGAAVLIGLTITAVAAVRLSGTEPAAQVPAPVAPVATRALQFEDRPNGQVVVTEPGRGAEAPIAVLESGTDGFIRGVLRSFARARRAAGIGPEQPFVLSQQANGRLLLEDPATGQRIDLRAYGATNVESFRKLLIEAENDS